MRVHLAWVAARGTGKSKSSQAAALAEEFLARCRPFGEVGTIEAPDESRLFSAIEKMAGRTKPQIILLDSRGKQRTSEEIADILREARDSGAQHLVFAIGGADGWSEFTRGNHPMLALGRITLPHELARVIMAEQIYRAFTILAGHPYHQGH